MKFAKLKKIIKVGLIVGIVVFVGIQFDSVPRLLGISIDGIGNNPSQRFKIDAPPDVLAVLRESCMDCHSNETAWPIYSRMAPSSWLVIRDVKKGRGRMNFSEWGDQDEDEIATDKENAWEKIEAGEMPPWFYIPMHPGARLNDAKRAILKSWLMPADGKAEKADETEKTAPSDVKDGAADK